MLYNDVLKLQIFPCRLKIIKISFLQLAHYYSNRSTFLQEQSKHFKMRKVQPDTQIDPQIIYRKNRSRLIAQNRQLYSEIFKLQSKVSAILTKNIAHDFKQTVKQEKSAEHRNQETKDQTALIKKLKKKILLTKNALKPQEKQDMRQALDDLQYLKKQRAKYLFQKQALIKKRAFKNESLELNKPIEQQRNKLFASYKSTQRQTFELKNNTLKIQKQINNLHKIKELAKTSVPKIVQNAQFQVTKIENEISKIKIQISSIQKQWQPRIDSLTAEYFTLKQIKVEKDQDLIGLQRYLNSFKNRILPMKEQEKIAQDRNRISQVVISTQKRQQINAIYESQRTKKEFFQQFHGGAKNQPIKLLQKQQKLEAQEIKIKNEKIQKPLLAQLYKNTSPRQQQQTQNTQTQNIKIEKEKLQDLQVNNEFSPSEDSLIQNGLKKQNKMFSSVAVGTTFYYNDEQEAEK